MSSRSPVTSPATNATSPPPSSTPETPPFTPSPTASAAFPPPPPTTSFESPPPPSTTSLESPPPSTTSFESPPPPPLSESGKMPTGPLVGMIMGIGIGGIGMLVAVGIFVIFYRRRKRKKMREQGLEHYSSAGPPYDPKNKPSGGPSQQLQKHPTPPDNAKVVMFPKPTPPPGIVSSYPPPSSMSSASGSERPPPSPAFGLSQSTFTYEELVMATNNFSSVNLLGEGGFGYVHKGVLPNGKLVAIKQLKAGSGQGEREFQAEVEFISRVHHRHLVSLVGYCSSGARRMLVYEFVSNSTLEFHLHGKGRPTMDWPTRMKIALGSAKGLAYLHEDCQPKIIHRDIKAANILLDHSFEAKVADFGLAKSSLDTDTHVSTRVMGTFGYLAPEYASSGKLTDKSDVFSFGVVLLELITGRQPIDKNQSFINDSMVEWARPLLTEALESGNFDALVDPRLRNDYDFNEMNRMLACAAACVRHSARLRPKMSQMVRALEGNMSLDDLSEGGKPGHSTAYSSHGSKDYDSSQYKEDLQRFRKLALESQEQPTSENSGPSSESGLHPSSSSTEGLQTTEEIELDKTKKDNQVSSGNT